MKAVSRRAATVVIYPASGTGAWEAALVNTLSPGDRVLMSETGQFAALWQKLADTARARGRFHSRRLAPRRGSRCDRAGLAADTAHAIKAVCVVHNETSTGVTSRIPLVRKAIDRAGHPALLMVDTISSLASIDYRHDEWGVDVTVAGSQKGLMLPPGLSFNAFSDKALAASKSASCRARTGAGTRCWRPNQSGYFPYTPATNLLYGLREALRMLAGRRPRQRVRAPRAPRRSHAPRGARLGPRNPLRQSRRNTAMRSPP